MSPSPSNGGDTRLEQALRLYLAWCEGGRTPAAAEFLAEHAALRDLLEPMLEEPEADAAPDDSAGGGPADRNAGRVLGEFRLIREVGRGGMGVVYEAVQTSLGRRVALKVLPSHLTMQDSAIARFRREAETAARLDHPGLVAVHSVGSESDVHFFAMDFIAGAPLDAIVREIAALPPENLTGETVATAVESACHRPVVEGLDAEPLAEEVVGQLRTSSFWSRSYVETMVRVGVQVADALDYAHRAHVVHRDVKPSNILLRPDGSAVLTDFGLAREVGLPSVTLTGEFAGTPYYVSPEQAMAGRATVDRRSDVFSLGATLYELVTLQRAFPGETPQEVFGAIIARDPRDPQKLNPKLAPDLAAVIVKALEKDPERRYQTAAALGADLQAFLDYRPVSARRVSTLRRGARWVRRNPVVAALAVALIVFAVGTFTWTVLKNRELRGVVADFRRMSDVRRVQVLSDTYLDLQAWHPDHAPELARWSGEARELVARRPLHEATLASLRSRGVERDGKWTFADPADQWQHDTLVEMFVQLDDFTAPDGPAEVVARWQEFVAGIQGRSIDAHRETWERVITDIADRASCPAYDGLQLRPQMGLVPLGKDPDSGLHEFAHLLSGAVPERGADGRLEVTPQMAIVLVLIPGGRATVGAFRVDADHVEGEPFVDPWAGPTESPAHAVEVEPYFLSKFEATHGQWLRATGLRRGGIAARNMVKPGFDVLSLPVETINWIETDRVLRAIGLVFPTGVQWERAARANTSTVWYTGNAPDLMAAQANISDRHHMRMKGDSEPDNPVAWGYDDGWPLAAPIGQFAANPFGLHDVIGNVSEWVRDRPVLYTVTPRAGDGLRPGGQEGFHMARGGSFTDLVQHARPAGRTRADHWTHIVSLGVRPARPVR